MSKTTIILLVRLALGAVGGWLLQHLFFPKSGWVVAVILGALVVAGAYLSEAWRKKGDNKG